MEVTFDTWRSARDHLTLDGAWCKVTGGNRTREGYARVDVDGSLILTDDNGDSHVFDRDEVEAVEVP